MNDIFPSFYNSFRCIANLCDDSCCKDWDIDVDSETEKFYKTVRGELGDKIRRLTITDEYGERVFINNNGKCPFWNDQMLCDIYIRLGENRMSETCRRFPRVTLEYGGFREHILSFACPEAARFMLETENAYSDFGGETELACAENDEGYLSFLLKARERTVEMLLNREEPFAYRLADCLEFNAQIQRLINGEEPKAMELNEDRIESVDFIFDMHLNFEIMSKSWKYVLKGTSKNQSKLNICSDFDKDFEKFAMYYIYRYYLGAESSGDVLYSIKRIACAYIITGKMDEFLKADKNRPTRLRVLQRYSKEVEHSYENNEKLEAEFNSDPRFSVESMIGTLDQLAVNMTEYSG